MLFALYLTSQICSLVAVKEQCHKKIKQMPKGPGQVGLYPMLELKQNIQSILNSLIGDKREQLIWW